MEPQANFLSRPRPAPTRRPNANISNQTMIAVAQQTQQRQRANNQAAPTNLSPELFLNRIINNGRQTPQNVTETQAPQKKPRRVNVRPADAPTALREERRQQANAQTVGELNAAGTRQNFQDMPSSQSVGNDPMYANLKSVLADIERIRGGDYPEHIKNRMLSNAYETAAQTAGTLDLGGIEDTAQAELVRYIQQQASANAATAKQTMNPVKMNAIQREGATKGGLNSVDIYNVSGAKDSQGESNERKFFKKETIVDENYRANSTGNPTMQTELKTLMPHLGINAGKGDEKVDRHMRDREIAYSLLNDYLNAGVSVGAREAVDENGNEGALLDEAKGMTPDEYGWEYLAPLNPDETTKEQHTQAMKLADSAVTDDKGVTDKTKTSKYGDRLKKENMELVSTSYNVTRKGKDGKDLKNKDGKPIYAPTLDVSNPQLHRDVNRMQILDSLTGHVDRHGNNWKIETDEQGNYKSLKAIDNDMSFGRNKRGFGERFHNNPGMGDGALIDEELANRVKNTPKQDLEYLFQGMFSDDQKESEEVIENLWKNMQGFNDYAERNKEFQVRNWTKEHAQKELLSATGALPDATNERKSHNTIYQRLMMTRLAKDPRLKTNRILKSIVSDEKAW